MAVPTVASSGWHTVNLTSAQTGSQTKAAGANSKAAVAIVTAAQAGAAPAAFLTAGGALSYGNDALVKVTTASAVAQNTIGTTRWRRVEFFLLDNITGRDDDVFRWTAPVDASSWSVSLAVLDHDTTVEVLAADTFTQDGGGGTGASDSDVILASSVPGLGLVASLCDNTVTNKSGQSTVHSLFSGVHHSMHSSEASVTSDTLGHIRSFSSGPWVAGGVVLGGVEHDVVLDGPVGTWTWDFASGIEVDTLSPGPANVAISQPLRWYWDFGTVEVTVGRIARRIPLVGEGIETPDFTEPWGSGVRVLRTNENDRPSFDLFTDIVDELGLGGDDSMVEADVSGPVDVDRDDAATHYLTLVGNAVLTPIHSDPDAGDAIDLRIVIRQDGTGGRTLGWGGTITWSGGAEPTMPTDPDSLLTVGLLSLDDGATWLGYAVSDPVVAFDDLSDVTITAPTEGDTTRYRSGEWVNEAFPSSNDPVEDASVWMPLTSIDGGEPVLVWDGDDSLIPTLVPVE